MIENLKRNMDSVFQLYEEILTGDQRKKFFIVGISDSHITTSSHREGGNEALISIHSIKYLAGIIEDGKHYPVTNITEIMSSANLPHHSMQPRLLGLAKEFKRRAEIFQSISHYKNNFYEEVDNALRGEKWVKNINNYPKKPEKRPILVWDYQRNPNVVAAALSRAKGTCERCGENAPFKRKADQSPYLEVHHIVPLSENGDDTVDNTVALCPNCHRFSHYG
jgi:predicted HNH restriction endonuclease